MSGGAPRDAAVSSVAHLTDSPGHTSDPKDARVCPWAFPQGTPSRRRQRAERPEALWRAAYHGRTLAIAYTCVYRYKPLLSARHCGRAFARLASSRAFDDQLTVAVPDAEGQQLLHSGIDLEPASRRSSGDLRRATPRPYLRRHERGATQRAPGMRVQMPPEARKYSKTLLAPRCSRGAGSCRQSPDYTDSTDAFEKWARVSTGQVRDPCQRVDTSPVRHLGGEWREKVAAELSGRNVGGGNCSQTLHLQPAPRLCMEVPAA